MRATSLGNALRDSQMSILATLDACSEAIEEHNELDAEYRVAVKDCIRLGRDIPAEPVAKLVHRVTNAEEDRAIGATMGRARRAGLPT
jgi:hypothetical protein